MKLLSDFSESEILSKLAETIPQPRRGQGVICGIGDDAAVLQVGFQQILITTDALQEKIHFDWRYTDPFLLGRKSLAVNLSDIAAMGGKARWAVIAIAIPSSESYPKLKRFYEGLFSIAQEFQVALVGGDTDRSLKGWKITVTLIGEVKRPVYRNGAKVGDEIWVTGEIGSSGLGFKLLQRKGRGTSRMSQEVRHFCEIHQNPTPRIQIGQALSRIEGVSSMMDVSDGLLLDLSRLCQASQVGAHLEAPRLPIAQGYLSICQNLRLDPWRLALTGGEDYELLFTASARSHSKISSLSKKYQTPLTCIGKIGPSLEKIKVFDEKGREIKFKQKGFLHFYG